LVSFGHCIVSPSIYSFWLHLWYLLVIVLSLLPFTASDYSFGIFGHCIVSPSIYSFWLHLWYLLVIVLSLLPFTASDYPFVIFWSLYCLSFHLELLITALVSFGHYIVSPSIYVFWLHLCYLLVIVLSLFPFTASDYSFGIFWSLYCLSFHLQLLITLWYLLVIVLSLLPFTASDYTFCIFWSLYCLSFHLQLLITPLVSFGHYIVSSSIYSFWLHLWYLLIIVLSLLPFTVFDYTFVIFWSLYCLSFHLRLLITPLLSFGHCIVSPSIYSFWLQLCYILVIALSLLPFSFWLHLWYLLVIVLSLLPFTVSDYTFGIL
jgi:hypothetical protein